MAKQGRILAWGYVEPKHLARLRTRSPRKASTPSAPRADARRSSGRSRATAPAPHDRDLVGEEATVERVSPRRDDVSDLLERLDDAETTESSRRSV
jgi:hypothetical protein